MPIEDLLKVQKIAKAAKGLEVRRGPHRKVERV